MPLRNLIDLGKKKENKRHIPPQLLPCSVLWPFQDRTAKKRVGHEGEKLQPTRIQMLCIFLPCFPPMNITSISHSFAGFRWLVSSLDPDGPTIDLCLLSS